MKSIKVIKKTVFAMTMGLALLLTACGSEKSTQEEAVTSEIPAETEDSIRESESKAEATPKPVEKKWGVYHEGNVLNNAGTPIDFAVRYPSLIPTQALPIEIAYQMDPTLVVKASNGNLNPDWTMSSVPDSLEAVLSFLTEELCDEMKHYRKDPSRYTDFAFEETTREMVMVNDLAMCKYTGIHSLKVDGELYELSFVAYATDLKPDTGAYILLMVIDESQLQTSMDPVKEGTIEEYALKMAESLRTE